MQGKARIDLDSIPVVFVVFWSQNIPATTFAFHKLNVMQHKLGFYHNGLSIMMLNCELI